MKEFFSRPWLTPIKWLVAALTVWLAFRKVPLHELWPTLAKANLWILGLAIFSQYLTTLLNALRWKVMLRAPGLGLGKYLYFVFVGNFSSMFLPSTMAAEAVKVLGFGRKYGWLESNIGITLFARSLGAAIQLAMGAAALLWMGRDLQRHGLFDKLHVGAGWIWGGGALVVLALILIWRFRSFLMRQKWVSVMVEVARDPARVTRVALITTGIQILSSTGVYALFRCIYPQTDFFQVVLFHLIIQSVLLIPFSMGGVGVREYLTLLLFSDIGGMPPQATMAVNIVAYMPIVALAATGGAWILFRRWKGDAPVADEA